MKIYNYHPEYFYYLGSSNADESPLEPGEYLIPAKATTKKPPEPQIDKVHIFVDDDWQTIDDLRGDYYSIEMESIGIYLKNEDPSKQLENVTKIVPPPKKPSEGLEWNAESEEWAIIPEPILSTAEKLAIVGLSLDELKDALGM
jgi:hypothetical protein